MLMARGVEKGDKVAILLMNCLDWLPIYFGILKTGALAVPMNFRYAPDEIDYCLDKADANVLIFGSEFIGRIEEIAEKISKNRLLLYFGSGCPTFAEDMLSQSIYYSGKEPGIPLTDDDDAAIYFSSGTTGFPKAILHKHRALMDSLVDCFEVCSPGEFRICEKEGIRREKIVLSGVYKEEQDIRDVMISVPMWTKKSFRSGGRFICCFSFPFRFSG